ncbi:putative ABC-type aminoglycoside exporter domain protein [Mycobacterium kansasii]|uniref:Putative ABC-type aminoglycoside exporter domain protein n=1 Tax=Mycobacterium kansasii TaxID=1768 RepID=A0A1V3WWN9_MYCKA|nr:putative ABC-type aminoglycoside exporter domain protein [Mycobacterium kansasii]
MPRALRGASSVVVTRRPSTAQQADRVALLEHGTITHIGTHAELLAQVPRYRHLMTGDHIDCSATIFASSLVEKP